MRTIRAYEVILSVHLERFPEPVVEMLRPLVMRHARQAQRLAATGRLTRRTAVEMAHEACRDIDDRVNSPEFGGQLRAALKAARPPLWRRLVARVRLWVGGLFDWEFFRRKQR